MTLVALDVIWVLLAAFLVFFMQAGFAMVESGMTRAKNSANIVMKNLMDMSLGSLAFFLVGFGFMFGTSSGGWIGTTNFMLGDIEPGTDDGYVQFAFFIFQTVFAATAATIVSGAISERTKFGAYMVYTIAVTAFIYPVFGHWVWNGNGWLAELGFIDFAGSTVVHSVGGWAALAGALVVGPRLGKFTRDGKSRVIRGHSIALAALGVFILWFGWFGFNAGSTVSGNDLSIAAIAVTTNLAAAAGAVGALLTSMFLWKRYDASMALNGVIAGLVSITAGAAAVGPTSAIMMGFVGGVLVVFSVLFLEKKLKIDDPVGAISAHGVAGAWGTIAVGLFAQSGYGGVDGLFFGGGFEQLGFQVVGVAAAFAWTFPLSFGVFYAIHKVMGMRASDEDQLRGLDASEHEIMGYPDFAPTPADATVFGTASEEPVSMASDTPLPDPAPGGD